MNKVVTKIGSILVAVAVMLGFKLLNKSVDSTEYQKQLIALCDQNSKCITSVHQNFDSCFENNYNLGGKRKAAALKFQNFVDCMNSRSDQPYFSVDPQYQG